MTANVIRGGTAAAASSDEVHGLPRFVGRARDGPFALQVLHDPRKVAAERAHRLDSFHVALEFRILQQIHFPTTGILRNAIAAKAEAANETAAVTTMASGVGRCGFNAADTGARMNMCRRYIP